MQLIPVVFLADNLPPNYERKLQRAVKKGDKKLQNAEDKEQFWREVSLNDSFKPFHPYAKKKVDHYATKGRELDLKVGKLDDSLQNHQAAKKKPALSLHDDVPKP